MKSQVILIFFFSITSVSLGQDYIPIKKHFNAVVLSRGDWYWYNDIEQTSKIGKLTNNEVVEIIGWVPWMVTIRKEGAVGYVTHSCFKSNDELNELEEIVEKYSSEVSILGIKKFTKWYEILALNDKFQSKKLETNRRNDSIDFFNNPKLLLRLSTSKKEIFEGECAVVKFSFFVSNLNQHRMQFYNLGEDLALISKIISKGAYWNPSTLAFEPKPTTFLIGKQRYQEYKLLEAAYCPVDARPIIFPTVSLRFAKLKAKGDSIERIQTFTTKAFAISVNPLPKSSVSLFDFYKPCGQFLVQESGRSLVNKHEKFNYKLTLYSAGLTFPIEAPKWENPNLSTILNYETNSDTIINSQYYSSKTWEYSIEVSKQGDYNLSQTILRYFNPNIQKLDSIVAGPRFQVRPEENDEVLSEPPSFQKKEVLIAFDVSQSMEIEDYSPNRLGFLKSELSNFISNHKTCNIGLLAFAGEAKQVAETSGCYNRGTLQNIDYKSFKTGTAIGDAVWLAARSYRNNNQNSVLILIGDGDNTAGITTPELAIRIAKKYRIKIYAIGIGHKGLVSYGKDYFGKPYMVDNTFSDETLRNMSLATGGKYFWAEKEGDIVNFIDKILKANNY
jgi:hypothetical protein